MDELRAAVRELASVPSMEAADALVMGIGATEPSAELAAFLCDTLELLALHEVRDSRGVPLRWRLVDRLLALGFPHALHVTPDDLDYHRARNRGGAHLPAAFTGIIAFISSVWAFGWGALIATFGASSLTPRDRMVVGLALAGMAVALAHGIAAFAQAVRVAQGRSAPALRLLGWMFFVAPLLAVGAELVESRLGVIALIFGAPAMLTALLCAITAGAVGAATPEPSPVFAGEGPLEAESTSQAQRARLSAR